MVNKNHRSTSGKNSNQNPRYDSQNELKRADKYFQLGMNAMNSSLNLNKNQIEQM